MFLMKIENLNNIDAIFITKLSFLINLYLSLIHI